MQTNRITHRSIVCVIKGDTALFLTRVRYSLGSKSSKMKLLHFFIFMACLFLLAACQTKENPPPKANPITHSVSVSPSPSPTIPPETAPAITITKELSLFDGKTLTGWKITDFGGHGEVEVHDGLLKLGMGAELTGITWTNIAYLPKQNYEIELDAMKLTGNDFFCALTFPVGNSHCSLVCGGWGGGVVGISSLDGMDASDNDTSKNLYFERNRWFHIRIAVTPQKITAWIDEQKVVDVNIEGRKISMRPGEIEMNVPLGLATWQTSAQYKNIKLKRL